MKKRVLSLLLCLVMALSLIPTAGITACAADGIHTVTLRMDDGCSYLDINKVQYHDGDTVTAAVGSEVRMYIGIDQTLQTFSVAVDDPDISVYNGGSICRFFTMPDHDVTVTCTTQTTILPETLEGSVSITGTAKPDLMLTAVNNSNVTSVKYQWLKDGVPISGATSKNYTVRFSDVGSNIACRISADGVTGVLTSAPVTVEEPTMCTLTVVVSGEGNFQFGNSSTVYTANASFECSVGNRVNLWFENNCEYTITSDEVTVDANGTRGRTFTMPAQNVTLYVTFIDMDKDIAHAEVSYGETTFTYNGENQSPEITSVRMGDNTLTSLHYMIQKSAETTIDAGTYYVDIIPVDTSAYEGYYRITYTIAPCSVASASVSNVNNVPYTGMPVDMNPVVTVDGRTLVKDTDYVISYTGNTGEIGTVGMTITGMGNYTGSKTVTFQVLSCVHTETEVKNAKAATCTTDGYTGDTVCKICGETVTAGTTIVAAGHGYDDGMVTKAATYTAAGEKIYTCTKCGETKTESIPKLTPTAPAAPTLSISKADGKITISWNAVSGANKYWIYRSTDGTNFKYYDMTTKTSYTNSSVTSGTKYYYKVKAVKTVDGKDYASSYSAAKSTIPLTTPTLSISKSAGKIKLSWNAVTGATKYWIYRSTDGTNFKYYDSTTKTSYTNSSVTSGTKYYYKVKAVKNVNGTDWASSYSAVKSTVPVTTPTLSATLSSGKIKLSWGAVTGATKYWIYRSTDGKNFSYYDSTTKTSYTNSSVTAGKTYYYKIKAVKTINSTDWASDYSNVVSKTR